MQHALNLPALLTEGLIELIRNNVELVKKITGNKKVPLLIYLTPSPVPDKATRSFSSEMVPEIYSAMAMIAPSALSRFIMTAVFAFQKPPIPMKSFSDVSAAKNWLKQQ